MPFRYANQSDVLANLREVAGNTVLLAYLYRIENALADVFDHKVGRSFGVATVPSTRTIMVGHRTNTLVLARPARSITDIAHSGTFDGSGYAGETVEDYWHEGNGHDGLIYTVERISGDWPNRVRVTAIWASDSDSVVPADVQHALTLATVKQYRKETSTPGADLLGPEGFGVPAPDPWNDAQVKAVIDKYRVVEVIV